MIATHLPPGRPPLHVAIIMDGNGRWATRRGLPRTAGHAAGARALEALIPCAVDCGISDLTLYAFSEDNWKRPPEERSCLFALMQRVIRRRSRELCAQGVAFRVVGRRDRLPHGLQRAIADAERAVPAEESMTLTLAIDYSSRRALHVSLTNRRGTDQRLPDVDLLIRTSGEQRVSDFLLWEIAYAEFFFDPTLWPDYSGEQLKRALAEFRGRDRRFGEVGSRGHAGAPSHV